MTEPRKNENDRDDDDQDPRGTAPKSRRPIARVLLTLLRWGIAIVGIYWVISNLSWSDHVIIPDALARPVRVPLAAAAPENSPTFTVWDDKNTPREARQRQLARNELYARTEPARVQVHQPDGSTRTMDIVARQVRNGDYASWPLVVVNPRSLWQRYWDQNDGTPARIVEPSQVVGEFITRVPYPIVDEGVKRRIQDAETGYLIAAVLVFPFVFLLTSWRWALLLRPLQIYMTQMRVLTINMVGAFYNTFLPGSTGGDVLKAYYAAKNSPGLRTRAVMSVIIDRVIGLLALIVLGGTMATYAWLSQPHSAATDAVARKCMQVSLGSMAILAVTALSLCVYYTPIFRKLTGLDFILSRLPMQDKVQKAREVLEIYRRRPLRILSAIVMTLPVHGIVVISATFAGMAFHLPLTWWYYWVVVPVVVLSGSIPISPQGAGVMEFFAIILTRSQGCTVTDAFALTMSIRLVQILWNLTGGLFVLKGGFHAPTETEQAGLSDSSTPLSATPEALSRSS